MPITAYKVIIGYPPNSGATPKLEDLVAEAIADGWQPYGGAITRKVSRIAQPMIKGGGTVTAYHLASGYLNKPPLLVVPSGVNLLGMPQVNEDEFYIQAYVTGVPYVNS